MKKESSVWTCCWCGVLLPAPSRRAHRLLSGDTLVITGRYVINISRSLYDTVSGCHGQIADGSSLQVSTRVRPEAEAESNLISETMTWLCARARPRACTEHNP